MTFSSKLTHSQTQRTYIKNKVSRGRFTHVFFLQSMVAIGADWIQVPALTRLKQGEGLGHGGAQELAKGSGTPQR